MRHRKPGRCGLSDINLRATLATIGVPLMVRHTLHCLATLHRLLGCGHAGTVETVRGKCGDERYNPNSGSGRGHPQ